MYQYKATVLKIVDGDTVDVLIDLGFGAALKQRVRLAGLNAPERFSEEGKASTAALSNIIPIGSKVVLESQKPSPKDKYGRYLATIHIGNANANQAMTDGGHAVVTK